MARITKIGPAGLDLIKKSEGFSAKPYLDPVGIPTIGYGNTYYLDGRRVKLKDKAITEPQATKLLLATLVQFEKDVDSFTTDLINQSQFDALVCFAYNVGSRNLKTSTLLKKVNNNPDDISILKEFSKWIYAGGKPMKGLITRRKKEAELYFS